MAKNPVCPYCGEEVIKNSDNAVKNNIVGLNTRSWYHSECHTKAQTQPKHEWPHKKTSQKEKDVWAEEIYDYLLRDQKISANMILIKTQMETYLKKGMTCQGMFLAIRYFYEVERKNRQEDNSNGGIGIVPYVYDRAKKYWETLAYRNNQIKNEILVQIAKIKQREVKTIKKKPQQKRKSRAPSLEEIEMGDD